MRFASPLALNMFTLAALFKELTRSNNALALRRLLAGHGFTDHTAQTDRILSLNREPTPVQRPVFMESIT